MTQERLEGEASIDKPALFQSIREHITGPQIQNDGNPLCDLDLKEAALVAYEQAILLAPREASLYYHKGQVLEQLGRLTEAKKAYEQAHRLGYNC